ncbi:MAG TPA: alpha-L-arabinofuranosidase C-terminal domain-containing protein [Acidisarcina sp.]
MNVIMTSTTRRRFLQNAALTASALTMRRTGIAQAASIGVDAHIDIVPSEPIATIAPEIYSHFIEQLGGVVYDGVWVGEKSKIPNQNGIRLDFINTMRAVQAPVLRWPGGCFADTYDWRDGIGPAAKRPNRAAFWGQQESNRYGLHEFMETCRAIGCRPYLASDVRSLPARDFYQMVEYCNAPTGDIPSNSSAPAAPDTLAAERAANGDRDPFNVEYWGVGNESWGCGGNQTPEEYAGQFRRYTAWLPQYNGVDLKPIAVGPNGDDVGWTQRLFKSLAENPEKRHLWGLSIHYYTSGSATQFAAGDALNFDAGAHYDLLARGSIMERVVTDHFRAIQQYGGQNQVKLVVDEWGAWYGSGTALGPTYNLSQQSTMRDALLSGITLDIFHRHADKVAMANVAQSINCIHSLMLAREDKFTVTPTFHVFKMYMPHRGATAVRVDFTAQAIDNPLAGAPIPVGGNSNIGALDPARTLAGLSGSASVNGRQMTLSVVNPHLDRPITTEIAVRSASIASVKATVLASADVHDHNDFEHPQAVRPAPATTARPTDGRLIHIFPPASVTTLQLTLV